MQQAVDAAQIDERAEIHHAADGAAADLAFGQLFHELFLLLFALAFQDVAPGEDDVAALRARTR